LEDKEQRSWQVECDVERFVGPTHPPGVLAKEAGFA